ncbi:uncharacterized protein [Rutidosis leptorrhynchoides]|uniref:uncharacterized protein n=1 Tax=Rutidosis leptorrhynchoides TaxID=125765 RepID=UPI003A9A03F8
MRLGCRWPVRGRAQNDLTDLISELQAVSLDQNADVSYKWSFAPDGVFKTKILSGLIDGKSSVGAQNLSTLRNQSIPLKVKIFVWRARQLRLPVRVKLDKRGIDLDSILLVESPDHQLDSMEQTFDDFSLFPHPSAAGKVVWQGLKWGVCYSLWKARNDLVFKKQAWNSSVILNNIQILCFGWISKRCKKISLEWNQWVINPASYVSSIPNRSGIG